MAARTLVGMSEIADRYGISRQLLNKWTKSASFPKPVAELRQGRIWSLAAVDRWTRKHRPERMPD